MFVFQCFTVIWMIPGACKLDLLSLCNLPTGSLSVTLWPCLFVVVVGWGMGSRSRVSSWWLREGVSVISHFYFCLYLRNDFPLTLPQSVLGSTPWLDVISDLPCWFSSRLSENFLKNYSFIPFLCSTECFEKHCFRYFLLLNLFTVSLDSSIDFRR